MRERLTETYLPTDESNATIELLVEWFLHKQKMSHKKIQKLCYYAQAWSQTLDQMDIIDGIEFEAWVHGPVNTEIWNMCKKFGWRNIMVSKEFVSESQKEINAAFSKRQTRILDLVWKTYKDCGADELEEMTHQEDPWKKARQGLSAFAPSHNLISRQDMRDYYINFYEA